ncbi:MAG: hypothetical protein ABIH66_07685 [bacterium]
MLKIIAERVYPDFSKNEKSGSSRLKGSRVQREKRDPIILQCENLTENAFLLFPLSSLLATGYS